MLIENPQFLAKKYSLSDPYLETKITEQLNQGFWIENIISNEDNILFIYLKSPNNNDDFQQNENIN